MIDQHGTLEISQSRLRHNLALIQNKIPPATKICATLKANAYGHGLKEIAQLLHAAQVPWIAVYGIEEATHALDHAPALLVLAPFVIAKGDPLPPELLKTPRKNLRLNLTDEPSAHALSSALLAHPAAAAQPIPIHIQVDTGLTRNGIDPEKAPALAALIAQLPALRLEGLFAHFSHADIPAHPSIAEQTRTLLHLAQKIKPHHPHLLVHAQNSAALWHANPDHLDMVRIGIALYGLQPSTTAPIPQLQPIARLTAPILALHERPPGTGVGYGHTFTTRRHTRLAIVPVGYAEGYPRALSNRALAQLHETNVPIVGRVSMDQTILDITDVPAARLGDRVTLISWDPAHPNSIDRLAEATGTIGYEIATGFGPRLKRLIVD